MPPPVKMPAVHVIAIGGQRALFVKRQIVRPRHEENIFYRFSMLVWCVYSSMWELTLRKIWASPNARHIGQLPHFDLPQWGHLTSRRKRFPEANRLVKAP